MNHSERCPNCASELMEINYDKINAEGVKVAGCTTCSAVFQILPNGRGLVPLKNIFEASKLHNERAMAAISKPTTTNLKSFLELYHMTTNRSALDLGTLGSALMEHLAQIEGLLDSALSGLAEIAMVPGPARDVYEQIKQARELVSVKPSKNRGTSTMVEVA